MKPLDASRVHLIAVTLALVLQSSALVAKPEKESKEKQRSTERSRSELRSATDKTVSPKHLRPDISYDKPSKPDLGRKVDRPERPLPRGAQVNKETKSVTVPVSKSGNSGVGATGKSQEPDMNNRRGETGGAVIIQRRTP